MATEAEGRAEDTTAVGRKARVKAAADITEGRRDKLGEAEDITAGPAAAKAEADITVGRKGKPEAAVITERPNREAEGLLRLLLKLHLKHSKNRKLRTLRRKEAQNNAYTKKG